MNLITEAATVCLALNIYFEAQNQPVEGQIAVSQVVMNRVRDARFPDEVCKVVKQGAHSKKTGLPLRWRCHFSWYCDGKSDKPVYLEAYRWAHVVAKHVISGKSGDLVNGATHYHATCVSPDWNIQKTRVTQIGDHIFYRWEK